MRILANSRRPGLRHPAGGSSALIATLTLAILLSNGCLQDLASDEELKAQLTLAADVADGLAGDATAGDAPFEDGSVADTDDGQQGDDGVALSDAVTTDVDGDDVPGDATVVGDQCVTDYDCIGQVKGLSPCRVPSCQSGFCTSQQLAQTTPCTQPFGVVGECELSRCDSAGECVTVAKPDGVVCGPYA